MARRYQNSIPRAHGILLLASSGAAASVSAGTAETQLASITIPANVMGANGKLRVTCHWTFTNSANNKTKRVRFGGSGGSAYTSVTSTTTVQAQTQCIISNNNATNVQKGYNNGSTNPFSGATSTAVTTGSVDTTAATTVYISGQTANSGETITLESYTVELIPGV